MTHVGFTGTSRGMTLPQLAACRDILKRCRIEGAESFHHGDCVGADSEAHDIAIALGYRIVLHPPLDIKARAFRSASAVQAALPYLLRNRQIVYVSDVLVAAPATSAETLRSGTWATVRYARRAGKPIYVLSPKGDRA